MKAVKYRLNVSIDLAHSWEGKIINEIFIPKANIIINDAGGLFTNNIARANISLVEINISKKQVDILKKYLKTKSVVEETRKNIFKEENK